MSGVSGKGGGAEVAAAPRRRTRPVVVAADVVRGARGAELERPAAEVLAEMPWQGPLPDPDVLDAVTYLAWL